MITKEEFEIAQKIISKRGKIHAAKHDFPFTGLLRCGECGAMITAEKKTKNQKNGNIHHYTYYRCTKRKGIPCSQPCIREEELVKQISAKIVQVEIPSEFREWAVEVLKSEHSREAAQGESQIKRYQTEYESSIKKLNNLMDMRVNGDIDQENYSERKEALLNEKARLQELIRDTDKNVTAWIETAENKLNVAETAKDKFATGIPQEQREVLENIGTKFMLKDRIFSFDLEDIFESVRTASKEVKKLHARLEPVENGFTKAQYTEMYQTNPFLGG